MATVQKFIRVGSSIAAVIPKHLLGVRPAGTPIRVERGVRANIFTVRVLPQKASLLNTREKRILSMTDAFIHRYRADLKRLKNA